jgi:hypothetical protein
MVRLSDDGSWSVVRSLRTNGRTTYVWSDHLLAAGRHGAPRLCPRDADADADAALNLV